jgi:hypothetical protein
MVDIRLERIFDKPAFPGLKVGGLMQAITDYQAIVEGFIPMVRGQMTVRFTAEMKRRYPNLDQGELREEYEGHEWLVSGLVPSLVGGSVLIALWATFEQGLIAIAGYVKEKEDIPISPHGLREQDLCSRFEQFVHTATRKKFAFTDRLGDIKALRNLYAHHNGSVADLPDQKQRRILDIVKSSAGGVELFDDHYAVVSPEFMKKSLARVDAMLESAIAFLDEHYPHTKE